MDTKTTEHKGYYCTKCNELCKMLPLLGNGWEDQALSCHCGTPWETEQIYEDKYPNHWIPVTITTLIQFNYNHDEGRPGND